MSIDQNISFIDAFRKKLIKAYDAFSQLLPCDLTEPPTRRQIINQLLDRAKGALIMADEDKSTIRADRLRKYARLLNDRVIRSEHANRLIARRNKIEERRQAEREKLAVIVDEYGENGSLFLDLIPPDDPLAVQEGMKIKKQIEILSIVKAKMRNPKPVDRTAIPADCELLTVPQLARMLGWGESVVRQRDKEGLLPAPYRFGGTIQWSRQDLINWIDAGCPSRQQWELRKQRKAM